MVTDSASSDDVLCSACGQPNGRTANFCEHCGYDLRTSANAGHDVRGADPGTATTIRVNPEDIARALATTGNVRTHSVACRTDIGHSHHVNQDAGGAWSWMRSDGTPVSLVIVADGVSAGRHSEGASRLAVDVIAEQMESEVADPSCTADSLLRRLIDAAKEANLRVAKRPHHSVSSADATTLVAAFCIGGEGGGVWCGDSRVYLVTRDGIERLTRDHSWAEGVVSHGLMTVEDAARDPRAHMITRWLGPPEQEDPGLEAFRFQMSVGDFVVCCSDGLYMYFSPPVARESEIAQVLRAHRDDLQGAIDALVEEALRRGGRDNITIAVVAAGGPENDASSSADQTIRFPFSG